MVKWIKPGDRQLPESFLKAGHLQDSRPDQAEGPPTELPGIDMATGISRVAGNTKLFRNLLQKFSQNQATALDEIKDALMKGDMEQAERLAHTIKGVAGNIGAMDLHAAAKDLEAGIKEDGSTVAEEFIFSVQNQLEIVLMSIATLTVRTNNSADETKPMDKTSVDLLILELKEFIENDDTDALTILEKLQLLGFDGELVDLLGFSEKALNSYDFEDALDYLIKFEERLNQD